MKNKILIAVIIVAAVLGVALFVMSSLNSPSPSSTPASTPTTTGGQNSTTTTPTEADATIKYTDSGFQPKSITIKAGQTVAFENSSSRDLQLNSDPHPLHADNNELNVGSVAIGATQIVTLTTKGTWGIHNHLDPGDQAIIIVQ